MKCFRNYRENDIKKYFYQVGSDYVGFVCCLIAALPRSNSKWRKCSCRFITYGMRVSYMLQHVVYGALRRIALAVITPAAGAVSWRHRRPAGRPAAKGFVALRISTWNIQKKLIHILLWQQLRQVMDQLLYNAKKNSKNMYRYLRRSRDRNEYQIFEGL